MTSRAEKLTRAGSAMILATASLGVGSERAQADPTMHQVVYIVTATNPASVDIFYQDQDPAVYADYSHNPYQFTPQVHADLAPGTPWVQPVSLLNPDQWAMVTATTGRATWRQAHSSSPMISRPCRAASCSGSRSSGTPGLTTI